MIFLALETSTALGGVALGSHEKIFGAKHSLNQKSHSEFLHPAIDDLLCKNDLSIRDVGAYICGIGPGSFTGIRISVGAAKTFGALLQAPLVPVTTLECLAYSMRGLSPSRVLCLINAYKNMVYYGFFEVLPNELRELQPSGAIHVRDLNQVIDTSHDFWIVGDGFSTYQKFLPQEILSKGRRPCEEALSEVFDRPLVENTFHLGKLKFQQGQTKDWTSILPLYIRDSEAEEQRRGIHLKPL